MEMPLILDTEKIENFKYFLNKIEKETYPEPPSGLHTGITQQVITYLQNQYPVSQMNRILDVGCGQGAALDLFQKMGKKPVGITLNQEDLKACREKGYEVYYMDQSFLEFKDHSFDLIWCRHCLEHSIFPIYTLSGFMRVLSPSGYLYVEVPAPGTSCHHEQNPNHYSVLGKEMWADLFRRTGFAILDVLDIQFTVPAGPDIYWSFVLHN